MTEELYERIRRAAKDKGTDMTKLSRDAIVRALVEHEELKRKAKGDDAATGEKKDKRPVGLGIDFTARRKPERTETAAAGPVAEPPPAVVAIDRWVSWIESGDEDERDERIKTAKQSLAVTAPTATEGEALVRQLDARLEKKGEQRDRKGILPTWGDLKPNIKDWLP